MGRFATNLVFPLLLVAALAACKPPGALAPAPVQGFTAERVEVRTERIFLTDTVRVEIPAQSEAVTTRDTVSRLENDYAVSTAAITADGLLRHALATKPQELPVPVEVPVERTDSIAVKYVEKPVPVEVCVPVERELTKWQRFKMDCFWVAALLLIMKFIGIYRRVAQKR